MLPGTAPGSPVTVQELPWKYQLLQQRYCWSPELTRARPGPPLWSALHRDQQGEASRSQRQGGVGRARGPGGEGAGGARGRAGLRVRSVRAAGTRRCARCLNEPGLPARATSRESAAGAGAASCPRRGGRRRPSGTRHGGLRRCARCRQAAASGDGDRAEPPRRAVTAAPPPRALSERRR